MLGLSKEVDQHLLASCAKDLYTSNRLTWLLLPNQEFGLGFDCWIGQVAVDSSGKPKNSGNCVILQDAKNNLERRVLL